MKDQQPNNIYMSIHHDDISCCDSFLDTVAAAGNQEIDFYLQRKIDHACALCSGVANNSNSCMGPQQKYSSSRKPHPRHFPPNLRNLKQKFEMFARSQQLHVSNGLTLLRYKRTCEYVQLRWNYKKVRGEDIMLTTIPW